jgi:hypothetical protein
MTMAVAVYILGALSTLICAVLLLRRYQQSRAKLLLWSGLCFALLTVSNTMVFVDLALLPTQVDLYLPRLVTAALGMSLLLYGLIWESQ